jgi:UDP-glucose 4-epimerase
MRYLITGGIGFIGSHLGQELLRRGHAVVVIDDLSTSTLSNVAHLTSHPDFSYVIDSVENTEALAKLVDRVDGIYHLAAAVGVRLVVDSPVRTIACNVQGTECVLRAAAPKRTPVLITSSSEVYGKSDAIPFREDGDLLLGAPTKGRWAYACSKAIDEFLALGYAKEHGLPTVVARLFNTVGARQTGRYGMVLPTFARQALRGEPITVFGDGTQRRTFVHVADVVRALVGLMSRHAAWGNVYNVGDTVEWSILKLAERIKEQANSSSAIQFVPYDEAYEVGFEDMPRRVPDTSKIRALMGWHPTLGMEEIIRDVLTHARQ